MGILLNFNASVPIALHETEMTVGDEGASYKIDIDLLKEKEFTFEVSGIVKNTNNTYTDNGINII